MFLLQLIDIMDYFSWCLNIETALHTWDKSHLAILYNSFYTFFNSICSCFVEDFYMYVYKIFVYSFLVISFSVLPGQVASVTSNSLRPHGLQSTRLLCPWGFSSKNTGVGYHFLLQGFFPTQGSNSSLPHCRQILYHLSHQGSPRILEWVAYPFSRGSSRPRN